MKKKEKLKEELGRLVTTAVDEADKIDKLDYFTIEINNHNGNLKSINRYTDIKKIY